MEGVFAQELPKILLILIAALVMGELLVRLRQSQFLGYLAAGVMLGPALFDFFPQDNQIISFFASLGLVFLLFEVGLETDFQKLTKEGFRALAVALIGVSLPFLFGWLAVFLFVGDSTPALFMASAMTATSVGITVAVLSEQKRLNSSEGRIILGAALLDDVIGLVLLSVVLGIAEGEDIFSIKTITTLGLALLFLGGALFGGRRLVPRLIILIRAMRSYAFLETGIFVFCLAVAWVASEAGLAIIVGAFIAGLMLEPLEEKEHILGKMDFLKNAFLPFFFVSAGALFNPFVIGDKEGVVMLVLISLIAVAGKWASGLGAKGLSWYSKSLIGAGMIPRGEVGLIFAASGHLAGVFDQRMYGIALGMIMFTTFITPPILRIFGNKKSLKKGRELR